MTNSENNTSKNANYLNEELRASGVDLVDFRELRKKPKNYRLAVPIVIRHMENKKYSEPLRNSMAQSIAFKEANTHWNELLSLFVNADEEKGIFRQGVAVALAASYSQKELPTLIALCKNQSYGDSRLLLLRGLRRSKSELAQVTLLEFVDDEKFGKQVTKWLKRSKSKTASVQ